eukprot:Hpha_TRINITY_DN22212_c0_g1::TRINITY_DN22212_c0_g1_i1::g.167293::m.167293
MSAQKREMRELVSQRVVAFAKAMEGRKGYERKLNLGEIGEVGEVFASASSALKDRKLGTQGIQSLSVAKSGYTADGLYRVALELPRRFPAVNDLDVSGNPMAPDGSWAKGVAECAAHLVRQGGGTLWYWLSGMTGYPEAQQRRHLEEALSEHPRLVPVPEEEKGEGVVSLCEGAGEKPKWRVRGVPTGSTLHYVSQHGPGGPVLSVAAVVVSPEPTKLVVRVEGKEAREVTVQAAEERIKLRHPHSLMSCFSKEVGLATLGVLRRQGYQHTDDLLRPPATHDALAELGRQIWGVWACSAARTLKLENWVPPALPRPPNG